jgi:hypothetical protein
MAWGARITATQLTSITTEQFFDQTPTLNPRESAHCRVAVDFPASPTDDAVIAVHGSLDGTSWSATPLRAYPGREACRQVMRPRAKWSRAK